MRRLMRHPPHVLRRSARCRRSWPRPRQSRCCLASRASVRSPRTRLQSTPRYAQRCLCRSVSHSTCRRSASPAPTLLSTWPRSARRQPRSRRPLPSRRRPRRPSGSRSRRSSAKRCRRRALSRPRRRTGRTSALLKSRSSPRRTMTACCAPRAAASSTRMRLTATSHSARTSRRSRRCSRQARRQRLRRRRRGRSRPVCVMRMRTWCSALEDQRGHRTPAATHYCT
mmetsp:Transcript_3028/g.8264  ORF Transcript_3028/g.8264 Transcript_3028/m.8264 type:complete len:226 (-) Transcript_3028:410-1087(-)